MAGGGDHRILLRSDPREIDARVDRIIESPKMSGGYTMYIGNHISWNVPGEAVERCRERSAETRLAVKR